MDGFFLVVTDRHFMAGVMCTTMSIRRKARAAALAAAAVKAMRIVVAQDRGSTSAELMDRFDRKLSLTWTTEFLKESRYLELGNQEKLRSYTILERSVSCRIFGVSIYNECNILVILMGAVE